MLPPVMGQVRNKHFHEIAKMIFKVMQCTCGTYIALVTRPHSASVMWSTKHHNVYMLPICSGKQFVKIYGRK